MNLIEIVMKLLGSGDTISKIASLLGIGQEQAGKAVGAAVPTILAGLVGAASKPGGGTEIANAVAQQNQGVLDNLSGLLSGGGASAAQGSNILGSLLGGGIMSQLGGVLSRFTGVGEGGIGKLLGLLTPIVLGAIGKHSQGLDGAGIASMLAGQKGNIASALPSGLGSMLSSAIPGLSGVLGDASKAASSATRTAANVASGATHEAQAAGSSAMKWLVPLILVGLALYFLPKMCTKVSDSARMAKDKADEALSVTSDSAKLVSDASGLIKNATENVASIKDEASAAAALPKLKDITTKLGGLTNVVAGLPAPVQKTVGDALRPLIAKLREAVQPVLNLPIVGAQVKPTVDAMLAQLDKLAPAA